jgi:hypothetical protein
MADAPRTTALVERATLLASPIKIPDHVVHRQFPTETVVLNLETGKYHGLNPVAGRMLEGLAEGRTVAEVARSLADEYGQPTQAVEDDLVSLCLDLLQRGLISLDAGARR